DRPADLGDIEITIAPREPVTSATIDAYAELGVSRLLVRPANDRGVDAAEADIRQYAPVSATPASASAARV
ncbi:MAG: hypothetical protein JO318_21545, partial [Chloroflexi bacterium]|nr:hypothetical protein [Chloroflexota bacterium]